MVENIVIVNDFGSSDGGAAAVARNTAIELSKKYNVYFFCSVPPIDSQLTNSEVKTVCIGKPDILHDKDRLRAVIKGIWDGNVKTKFKRILKHLPRESTIVHVHTWTKALTSAIFDVTAELNLNLIVTFHDYFLFCPNGGFYNYKSNRICDLRPLSTQCLFTNCDSRSYTQKLWRVIRQIVQNNNLWKNKKISFISISNLTRKICSRLVKNRGAIYDLNDPVELNKQEPVNISNNEFYIFVGRLSPEKGAQLFCQAISNLGLKGMVIGDGYMREQLQKEYPNIKFTGWASGQRKDSLMRQAKALIMPSFWGETFGLVVAEAKSFGIPCIVPDKCAASEQIEDGKTGFIFESGNLASLEETIKKYESSDIVSMQRYLIKTFDRNSLSLHTHLKKLIKIYEDVLSNDKS